MPKTEIIDAEDPLNKKLFSVTFITLIFIVVIIAAPVTLLEVNRRVDNLNLSFVNDPEVLGKWTTVGFVKSPDQLNPELPSRVGNFLNEMTFFENGEMKERFNSEEGLQNTEKPSPWLSWTKGYVLKKEVKD